MGLFLCLGLRASSPSTSSPTPQTRSLLNQHPTSLFLRPKTHEPSKPQTLNGPKPFVSLSFSLALSRSLTHSLSLFLSLYLNLSLSLSLSFANLLRPPSVCEEHRGRGRRPTFKAPVCLAEAAKQPATRLQQFGLRALESRV